MSKEKTKNSKKLPLILVIVATLLITSGIISMFLLQDNQKQQNPKKGKDNIVEKANKKETSLSLIAVGDSLIHGAVYADASEKGTYNFNKMLTEVKPLIEGYDLAFYNQETILGGTELGLSSYPLFNSPQEVGDAFIDAGFNMVSLATNHSLDYGEKGLNSSLAYWDKQENILYAGSYSSEEERTTPKIMEKNGITYTLLAYSTLTNGLTIPKGKEYLFSLYEEEKVKEDIERVRDKVDVVIVSMHWGEEYTHTPTNGQVEIANYLSSIGVDIVIGHHPHVIQPIEFIDDTMVIYSLGNFISAQRGIEKLTGLMASVTVKKVVEDNKTTITLEEPTAELVYTYSIMGTYRSSFKLYPYNKLNDSLLPSYKTYYEKYMDIATGKDEKIKRIGLE